MRKFGGNIHCVNRHNSVNCHTATKTLTRFCRISHLNPLLHSTSLYCLTSKMYFQYVSGSTAYIISDFQSQVGFKLISGLSNQFISTLYRCLDTQIDGQIDTYVEKYTMTYLQKEPSEGNQEKRKKERCRISKYIAKMSLKNIVVSGNGPLYGPNNKFCHTGMWFENSNCSLLQMLLQPY